MTRWFATSLAAAIAMTPMLAPSAPAAAENVCVQQLPQSPLDVRGWAWEGEVLSVKRGKHQGFDRLVVRFRIKEVVRSSDRPDKRPAQPPRAGGRYTVWILVDRECGQRPPVFHRSASYLVSVPTFAERWISPKTVAWRIVEDRVRLVPHILGLNAPPNWLRDVRTHDQAVALVTGLDRRTADELVRACEVIRGVIGAIAVAILGSPLPPPWPRCAGWTLDQRSARMRSVP